MAVDEGLAERIREALREVAGVGEKRMCGGICFTLGGNMMVGVVKDAGADRVARQAVDCEFGGSWTMRAAEPGA